MVIKDINPIVVAKNSTSLLEGISEVHQYLVLSKMSKTPANPYTSMDERILMMELSMPKTEIHTMTVPIPWAIIQKITAKINKKRGTTIIKIG